MIIEKLISISKQEKIPEIDVTDKVISAISVSYKIDINPVKPMGILAAISSVAACVILFFSSHAYKQQNDPFYLITQGYEQIIFMDYQSEVNLYMTVK